MKVLIISLFFITHSYAGLFDRIFVPKDENVLKKINEVKTQSLDPAQIDVLVWNIYKGMKKNFQQDFSELAKGKEILILQESIMHTRVSDKLRRMPWMEYIFATAWYNIKYLNSETGVMTGSTAETLRKKWQRSYYLEPILRTPKMTLFTEYKLKGRKETLLVGNIHGINIVRAFKLKHMLKKAAEVFKNHQGPAIFAGDFNTWTQTKIQNMNKIFQEIGFTAVQFENDIRTRFKGKPLDHTWIKGLKILKAKVPDVDGSDHKPMVLSLSL